jgi:hypothetical protein
MIDEVLRSCSLTLGYLQGLIADVPDEMMTRQSHHVVNHPSWVIGHLTYSCQAIGGEMGLDPWLPADWSKDFGTGSTPTDEPERYPKKASLLAALADGQKRLATRLSAIGEVGLQQPLSDEGHRPMFPTLGHAVTHILTSHAAIHVGQLTVWRRAVGLGPLTTSFT